MAYAKPEVLRDAVVVFKYIEEQHDRFSQSSSRQEKDEALGTLRGFAKNYLNSVPHDLKFQTKQLTSVLCQTVTARKDTFEPREASEAFLCLAKYAQCLLEQPWRLEFKQLLLCSAYYIHNIQAHLENAHEVLIAMGYVQIEDGKLMLARTPNLETLTRISRDCIIASQECEILAQLSEYVRNKTKTELSPVAIFRARCSHVGDVPSIGTKIVYEYNHLQYQQKVAQLSQSSSGIKVEEKKLPPASPVTHEMPERELVQKVLNHTRNHEEKENLYDSVFEVSAQTVPTSSIYGAERHPVMHDSGSRRTKSVIPDIAERSRAHARKSMFTSSSEHAIIQPLNVTKVPKTDALNLLNPPTPSPASDCADGVNRIKVNKHNYGTNVDDMVAQAQSYKFNLPKTNNEAANHSHARLPKTYSDDIGARSTSSSDSWGYKSSTIKNTNADPTESMNSSKHKPAKQSAYFETNLDDVPPKPLLPNDDNTTFSKEGFALQAQASNTQVPVSYASVTRKDSTSSQGNAPIDMAESKWQCPHCTYVNYCDGKVCQMCSKTQDFHYESEMDVDTPKPRVPANDPSNFPVLKLETNSGMKTIKCPFCTLENSATKFVCEACNSRLRPLPNDA